MPLWDAEGLKLDDAVLAFTVGEDPVLDRELLPYDCLGSAAHARMLQKIGVLSDAELDALLDGLREAFELAERGELDIAVRQEDGHTALEELLTERVGEAGKKIHTGRSRNDQVLCATRLMVRERLLGLADIVAHLATRLLERGSEHHAVLMPGFTHTRQAMPSTVGQLFFGAAEGLVNDLDAVELAVRAANRGPLGSASGYGVPLPLDRQLTSDLLGFEHPDVNTLYVQNTRGVLEASALFALHRTSVTLSRLATDLIAFSSEAYGFFGLPQPLTTGSSIMPQKRNPDVLELVRALPSSLLGAYADVSGLLHGLGAGYHRDLQRTKAPLVRSLIQVENAVVIMRHGLDALEVFPDACEAALRPEVFATDRVYARVRDGESFRDAYRVVKNEEPAPLSRDDVLSPRTHLGAPGTDQREAIAARLSTTIARFELVAEAARLARAVL